MLESNPQRFAFNNTVTKILSAFAYIIFVLLLVTPFVTSNLFVDSVLTPKLIWFTSISTIFCIVVLFYLLFKKSNYIVRINAIDIAVFSFFIYLHLNHYFTGTPYISSKISISTAIFICYIALRVTLSESKVSKLINLFIPVIYIKAILTSIIVLYQYIILTYFSEGMGIIANMGNSGAVGSYLAILFPWLLLFVDASKKNVIQYFYRITIALTLITLFLTQARAAWVAVILCSLILIVIKNRAKIKEFTNRYKKGFYLAITLFVIFLFIGGYAIFGFKKDSANGRLFIWKRTLELILDTPLTGIGFAKYGSEYPLYQATYLQNHPDDPLRFLAGDINHPFNEYLNITAELGVIGILLFGVIFYFIFKAFRIQSKSTNNTLLACYGTIITFLILAFFTYPFEIFSVQFLLFCCIAIISSEYQIIGAFAIQKNGKSVLMAIACVLMFFVLGSEFKRFEREKSWKKVFESKDHLSWNTCSKIFEELYPSNKTNWDFLSIYGIELAVHKEYEEAIPILQDATRYMKTSNIYTHLGISYEETGDFENSKTSYEMAIHMVPHKFFPKYRLVYLYKKMGLQKEALELAERIVTTPAKINSTTVRGIKYEMRKFLKQNGYGG